MKTILCLMAVGVAVAAGARDRGSYAAFPFAVSCDEAYVLQTSAYCRARDVYGLQIAPVRNRADGTVFAQLFNVAYYKSGDPTCWPLMTLEW